ncbi:MAG: CAP domain-containing protein [Agathobaculum sp.]|jgi:uncharacterized protein YkwD|uniref:CAP domain-containing protein n=1 Tax=Agathobaculum sp. TaxID=2048138 RepID=UPI003D8FE182
MKMKRLIPIALALTVATTAAAGAVESYDFSAAHTAPQHRLCERFDFPFCDLQPDGPSAGPETDGAPDAAPDTPVQKPDNGAGQTQGAFAAQVAALVNQERAKAGLPALRIDAGVQRAAQVRAGEAARSFSHTRPNGASCFTALSEAGVSYRGAGENIAYGQASPQEVMRAWMNSPGHRQNILHAGFTTIGVGYTVINGTPYWAQMFTY